MTQQPNPSNTSFPVMDLIALRRRLLRTRECGSRNDMIWHINTLLAELPKPGSQNLLSEDELHAHVGSILDDEGDGFGEDESFLELP